MGAAGVGAFIFVSCSTFERTTLAPPQIEGASFVGNNACADCHTAVHGSNIDRRLVY